MNWKKEIELLRKKQNGDGYGLAICNCIEEVMDVISKQGHSGMSHSIMCKYLIRLLKDKPIFPLTSDPSEWGTSIDENQNNRYTGLFKEKDGTYRDINRTVFVDLTYGENSVWSSGECEDIVNKLYPITLPYMPKDKPYTIYGRTKYLDKDGNDLSNDPKYHGSYNYKELYYLITPEGDKIELNKIIDERGED